MKLKDCPECGPPTRQWAYALKVTPYEFTRRIAKREMKRIKRDHNKMRRHDYPWKNEGGRYVSGCYKKTLIHNGGK